MGLLSKFLLLMGLLSSAVLINIASAAWAIGLLERELSWPLESMQSTLDALHEIHENLTELDIADFEGSLTLPETKAVLANAFKGLDTMQAADSNRVRVGTSTIANLRIRFERMDSVIDDLNRGEPGARRAYRSDRLEAIVLISRIEQRVIDDASLAFDFGDGLRRQVFTTILISVMITLASIGLSAIFVRRWVLLPVESLRRGAQAFAGGDLSHRVPENGSDQLSRLAADFNIMASTIDRLQTERIERERLAAIGEMLRRVVHNLRTPLAGIRGLAESTREDSEPGGDIATMQTRIIGSVDRFESWLRDLLKVSNPLEVRRVPTALGPWLEELMAGRSDAASTGGVDMQLDIDSAVPDSVEIDPVQLGHAVVAVLDNAIFAAGPGGQVCVTAGPATESGYWILELSDTGPGISGEDLGRIFEPTFTTKPQGTGIGLAMTRSIVDAHDGRIEVEKRRDGTIEMPGTLFRFVLPV